MPDLLMYGDTVRHASMRHELPLAIMDPFLYAEHGGERFVVTWIGEAARISAACPDVTIIDIGDLGFGELLESGITRDEVWLEVNSRAVERIGVQEAIVDFDFPLGMAERLRGDGVRLTVDDEDIKRRRRAKTHAELEGIRRAQAAAQAGMAAAAALLARARASGDGKLLLDGEVLRAETVRAAIQEAVAARGARVGPDVIVASVWQGTGHEPGSGPLPAGLPIEIDLWPQDEDSGCWGDMTRTFVAAGEPPEEARRQERLVREALQAAYAAIRPGVTGRELHALACEPFEREGYRTQRTGPGDDLAEGFQFSLGHGVGLEVHEDPALGQAGREPLVEGDVLAVEPGLWDRQTGGVRFEDLVLVTADGYELLNDFPYSLSPGG
jgi:Xaa-Pro aminopeptidase